MTTGRWNWEFGLMDDICKNGEAVRDRILLAIYGTFSNAKKDPRNAHRKLVTCPFVLGKRESRRLMGDYIFCEQDVTEKRQFEDAVATGSWSIDLHYTIDEKVPFLTRCEQGYFGRYWIPYRSLYSRNVTNLFMAGRCFSCTHVGLGSPRVMNTLAQMGCVVGEAAAMCRKGGYSPRGLYSGGHVRELQRRLGGAFPGVPDPKEKGWLIVDDEDKSVSFEGDWYYSWNCNGGAVGLRSHFALKRNAKAVYPLPVKQKGHYLLKGRVPHLFTTSAVTPARLTIYSGGKTTEIVWNQLPESGTWRDLGTVDLEPGATLEMTAAVEGQPSNGKDEIDSFVADGFALFAVGCDSFNAREYAQRPLKVLMIGNSFSICVLRQMPAVADAMGLKLDLSSMHIGGCSLERHWTNLVASVNADFKPYGSARCASAPRCSCLATSLESDA